MDTNKRVNEFNEIVNKELWYDFAVNSFDGYNLVIDCGIYLHFGAIIQIKFTGVSFCLLKSEWTKKDAASALEIIEGESAYAINVLYNIEIENTLFRFNHDDNNKSGTNAYIVAAESFDFLFCPTASGSLKQG